jgi:tRNA (guanine26-N2/guanine27-N2)-dimethyltransferase
MKLATHREESVLLRIPEKSFSDPHHCEVFYNPAMRFSRSMASLAFAASRKKIVLDGLCATGAKGLRLAKENKAEKVFLLDANPAAIRLAEHNISLNKFSNVTAICQDFNEFCLSHTAFFDFIEIDPFGTPTPFLNAALVALKNNGVLSVTSTDLANLCGKKAPCEKFYQAKPLKNAFSHETALRILLGKIALVAKSKGFAIKPLVCYYQGHHVKAIVTCSKGKAKIPLDFLSYCEKCLTVAIGRKTNCKCGNRNIVGGPLWAAAFCDKPFLRKMLALNESRDYADERKIEKTLSLLLGEQLFPPFFYDLHFVADHFGLKIESKTAEILARLKKKGFRAVRTHFEPLGIKTNAPVKAICASL